jgi:hypothetical protein
VLYQRPERRRNWIGLALRLQLEVGEGRIAEASRCTCWIVPLTILPSTGTIPLLWPCMRLREGVPDGYLHVADSLH